MQSDDHSKPSTSSSKMNSSEDRAGDELPSLDDLEANSSDYFDHNERFKPEEEMADSGGSPFMERPKGKVQELVRIFRKKIEQMDLRKYSKSKETAAELRTKGNEAFAKRCYNEALELYTEATLYAPFNPNSTDNEEFALALANRSAALFHLKKYKECLADIELSLKNGYPVKSRPKLILRKSSCEQELSKLITNDTGSSAANVQLPVETDRSQPSTSAPVTVEPFLVAPHNDRSGRGLIAARNIRKGELVLAEKPFASVLDKSFYKTHCFHCLKKLPCRPMPCRQCCQIRYCSTECDQSSWQNYHQFECRYLDLLNIREDFHFPPKLVLRIIAQNTPGKCLEYQTSEKFDDAPLPRSGYPAIYSLVEHDREDRNDYGQASALILSYLIEALNDRAIISTGSIDRLDTLITKHIRQINVNAITIVDKLIDSKAAKDEPQLIDENIGCGLYLTARLLNHSCKPNVIISCFEGDRLVLHAVEDIPVGQELFHCYGTHHKWQIQSQRHNLLKESYFFDCGCMACENRMQPTNKAFRCPDCSGPVVADGPMRCAECGTTDRIDVQKTIADTEAALKLIKLGNSYFEKGDTDRSQYLLAEQAFKEAHDNLTQVLYKSNKEILNVIKRLRLCAMRTSKFDEAVIYSNLILELTTVEFDYLDYHRFNSLSLLINSQKSLYLSVKAKQPLDKNKLNTLKTELLKNLDRLDELRTLILANGSQESIMFAQRFSVIRKLL